MAMATGRVTRNSANPSTRAEVLRVRDRLVAQIQSAQSAVMLAVERYNHQATVNLAAAVSQFNNSMDPHWRKVADAKLELTRVVKIAQKLVDDWDDNYHFYDEPGHPVAKTIEEDWGVRPIPLTLADVLSDFEPSIPQEDFSAAIDYASELSRMSGFDDEAES